MYAVYSSSRQSFSSGEDSSDSELVDHDYNSHIFAAKKVINKGRWSTEEVRCNEGGVKYSGIERILTLGKESHLMNGIPHNHALGCRLCKFIDMNG